MIKKIIAQLKYGAKKYITYIPRIFNVNLLDKEKTLEKLEKSKIYFSEEEVVELSPVQVYGESSVDYQTVQIVKSSPSIVYELKPSKKVTVLAFGGVKLDNTILNLDFGSAEYIRSLFKRGKRSKIHTEICIPLWSHYWGGGYYDYIMFIYLKILLIKSVLNESDFKIAKFVYPVFGTPFERDLFELAGLSNEQVINSRLYDVKADKYYVVPNVTWCYPNKKNILLLKQLSLSLNIPKHQDQELIFISRKVRRRLSNEVEIVEILKEHNFTFIEDKPRSVADQISLYKNAKVIIGPHGASFSNIIWCDPGTKLVELFSNGYDSPNFRYLTKILELKYYAIFENGVKETHYTNLYNDSYIEPNNFKIALSSILND
ncbi:glycosyltransferase family 61 protein [uncultured Mucilaginibacter sp.]|uniref:glycosyltransferase family 61 protein n=1 Tax=uncultured Mucilaginibacter sp. TaxID=797541 RepID=UPI002638EFC3|nr:glycosyltransferase family 61 protein [uncultured Mucilaginibacter sp.]